MPREARMKSSTGIYHVIMRGVNKQMIFEEDEDKLRFLQTLSKYKKVSQYQIFSYCLMDNHVHLLIKESDEALSVFMKRICTSYVRWFNNKYERIGHLFQARFQSEVVENPVSFLKVLRYIHQNPLKAGLVENVFDSSWTSVNEYLHKSRIVDVDYGLDLLSPNREKAIRLYIKYMQQFNNEQFLDVYIGEQKTDQEVREYLYSLGLQNTSQLQQMEKSERDEILSRIKSVKGVSIRQLSRVTGISKSVIGRV